VYTKRRKNGLVQAMRNEGRMWIFGQKLYLSVSRGGGKLGEEDMGWRE